MRLSRQDVHGPTDLGALAPIAGSSYSIAWGINDSGQVVGSWAASVNAINPGSHPFLYSNGTLTHLSGFAPTAINDNGVMVGGSLIDSGGTVQNLNSLIPAKSGYQINYAVAINDNGQIIAQASDATTSYAAVLLNPN